MSDPFDLDAARKRAKNDQAFSTEAGLDEPYIKAKKSRKPSLLIPETLDGEDMHELLMTLARTQPRRMKKALRAIEWLIKEGEKAGVW